MISRIQRFLKLNLSWMIAMVAMLVMLTDAFFIGCGSPLLHPAIRYAAYAMFLFYIYTMWVDECRRRSKAAKDARKARALEKVMREKRFEQEYNNYRRARELGQSVSE